MTLPPGLLDRPIAHRGLWSAGGRPENSLAAFRAAIDHGYGVELDVQLSADGEAMVFHDETLERMTHQAGILEERTADDLGRFRLLGCDETIPTLAAALALIGDRALVLVELKTPAGQEGALEQRVAELLDRHPGPVAVIGFNSASLAWFAAHRPGLARGLDLETPSRAGELDGQWRARQTDLAHIDEARPHFLLPRLEMVGRPDLQQSRRDGLALIPWTVRRPAEWQAAASLADNYIFEDMLP